MLPSFFSASVLSIVSAPVLNTFLFCDFSPIASIGTEREPSGYLRSHIHYRNLFVNAPDTFVVWHDDVKIISVGEVPFRQIVAEATSIPMAHLVNKCVCDHNTCVIKEVDTHVITTHVFVVAVDLPTLPQFLRGGSTNYSLAKIGFVVLHLWLIDAIRSFTNCHDCVAFLWKSQRLVRAFVAL